MDKLDWGSLPAEIIKMIFVNLEDDNSIEYRLVNRQWYFASLAVVYKNITINDFLNNFDYSKRLNSIYSLFENPSYNIGQYVKALTFSTSTSNLHILGLLMDRCVNVEIFNVTPTKALNEYIASAQRNNTDTALWGKLQKVERINNLRDLHNLLFQLMHLFKNSLEEICLYSVSSFTSVIEDDEDEKNGGNEEDLYAYIKKFRCLRKLYIGELDLNYTVLDCEKLLQHCPTNLNELELGLNSPVDAPNTIQTPSQSQLQLTYSYKPYPTLKKLIIYN